MTPKHPPGPPMTLGKVRELVFAVLRFNRACRHEIGWDATMRSMP